MDKKVLIRNFARCASTYDRYCAVQTLAGKRLLGFIKGDGFKHVLELGSGTGNFTLMLRERFKQAQLEAVEICPEMAEVAREKLNGRGVNTFAPPTAGLSINPETDIRLQTGDSRRVDFIVQDAERLKFKEKYDLIASNACFQWFNDLAQTVSRCKKMLKDKGIILFSLFGPQTFQELASALKYGLGKTDIAAGDFITPQELGEIVKENFGDYAIKEVNYTGASDNLSALFRQIRFSGIRGKGINNGLYLGSSALGRVEKEYSKRFSEGGRLKVTYQIMLCRAKKI